MDNTLRLVVASPTLTFVHSTTENSLIIGRSLSCDFNIPKEDLSREHCLFEQDNGKFYITDLNSKNGIYIDRIRIPANTRTEVNNDTLIVLSNIYRVRINPLDVQSKKEILENKINHELETITFEIDVPEKKSSPRKLKSSNNNIVSQTSENMKMVIGFVIILGFIIYQAMGR